MNNPCFRSLPAALASAALVAALALDLPTPAQAGWRDCGQPVSTGPAPTATDARVVLAAAVGVPGPCGARPCSCDVSGDGAVTAGDALRTLKLAVGQDVTAACDCPPLPPPCTSATLTVLPGSEEDRGWTGLAHDSAIAAGFSIELDIVRRCTSDQSACSGDDQCPDGGFCLPTCDCNTDPECEVVSRGDPRRCRTTMTACATNSDCPIGVACVEMLAPPSPLSSGGTPVCDELVLTQPLAGTLDLASGEAALGAEVLIRTKLGITLDQPCPRCGAPDQDPQVGDVLTCSGGQFHGAACTVHAVTPGFGGTSYDCPPDLASGISGTGRTIRLREVTTGTTSRTAQLPCGNFAFWANPAKPGSNPKCLDTLEPCTSNADCRRCTGNTSIACADSGDCTGAGACAEAPDQPVTCGFWCNCGFCDNDPDRPCFESADCPDGQACVIGTGTGTQPNAPQSKPNDCSADQFACGQLETERCATSTQGSCSLQPYRNCSAEGDPICPNNNAGECILEPRPCFESRITRSGAPSPLGSYCALGAGACTADADCPGQGDSCRQDSALPETVALACLPASSNSAVNNAGGLTGPSAWTFRNRIVFHREGQAAGTPR